MTKAVLFDLDGTLVNTEPMYWAAWREVLVPHGVTLTDPDLHGLMGSPPSESAKKLVDRFDLDIAPEVLSQGLIDIAVANPNRQTMVGAAESVVMVRDAGLPMAIATSATIAMTTATLRGSGLDRFFDVVVSAETLPYGKPHPGVFLEAASRLGVDPIDCVVIEDAPNGIIAAKAARMRCVAVPEPYFRDHPALGIADVVLPSLADITLDHLG
jgi:beta-phosphoglucomutase-like phosphatase (HAD superfamily)